MLLQSQTGELQLLPALPKAWLTGSVQGLRARGDFEILNMEWKDGKIVKLSIKSLSGEECKLQSPNALKTSVQVSKNDGTGNDVAYSFKTEVGKVYDFEGN